MTIDEAIEVLRDEHSYGDELNKACLMGIDALEFQKEYQEKVQKCIDRIEDIRNKNEFYGSNFILDGVLAIIKNEMGEQE